ncbi:hypothetical protein KY285_030645 [Solanum tuberosum]|uniref:Putative plant transposon protein domain-containing protein n=1 Tax=Solanum tuberosum TaxID=4113 RepID=M1DWN5_SOLTU|nr:hypothetical protein KY285_030645 [Solanum tuberosum]
MEFIFADPKECNLHMVWEFYANWAPEARSHYVTVRGRNVPITPTCINDIIGTPQDIDPLVLTGLIIRPSYQAIRHTMCGPQSMAQWTNHDGNRYHQSLPYTHTLRETRVWLKVVMNCLIPGLHYIDITRDRVCLVYALMTGMELNIGAIVKFSMRKSRVHKGHKYAFGGLITKLCRVARVPEKNVDYMSPLYPAPLGEVERRYPLNDHARALLGIGLEFQEPIENDIPTDEENMRTGSDVDSDSEEEIDLA